MNRYQLHDEFGIVRAFSEKSDAINWQSTRPELKLVIVPKQKSKPFNTGDYEECLL